MDNKSKLIEKLIFYTTFFIFFIIGLKSFQDYGISLDENCHRETGLLFYKFIKGFFFELDNLQKVEVITLNEILSNVELACFRQPVVFDLPIEFIVDIFNIKNSQQIFHLRHLINFLYFFVAIYFFFKILRKRFSKKIYAYIGIIILFCSPRIFAESFYNNKDIFFLSFTIIYFYAAIIFIDKPSIKSSLFFSIATALAFDIRIMAVLFITTTYFIILIKIYEKKNYFKKNIKPLLAYVIFTPIFITIFWPYLWLGGLDNLIFIFQNIPKTLVNNFYLGNYFYPQNTPWHYNFVWISITTPTIITIFFIIGFVRIFSRNMNRIFKIDDGTNNLWSGNREMYDLFSLYAILITFLSLIMFDYDFDSWRHLYFIYPFIIMISLSGIYFLNIYIKKKIFKIAVFSVIFLEIIFLTYWNIKYHPHQYVFFNPLIKNYAKNHFDLDYWGLSNKFALEYIIKNDDKNIIKIARASFTSLQTSLLILDKEKTKRIKIVGDLKEADYVINNHRKGLKKIKNIKLLDTIFVKFHEIKVDGIIINTIYKKIKQG